MLSVDKIPERSIVNEIANFVRGFTIHLGLIPIGYGILTFVFGDDLWGAGMAPTYEAALSVPWAPQSWGMFAATCGIVIIYGELAEKHWLLSAACFVQGIWCFTFGIFFLVDCFQNNTSFGTPGVWIYCSIGVMYWGRSRLAWIWR